MNKKKILIVENSTHITGALKAIVHSAVDLSWHFEFIFVVPKDSKGKSWVDNMGFKTIYELPMRELRKDFFSLLLYFPMLIINVVRFNRIIAKERIDLVHSNDLYNMLPVIVTRFGRRVPYICHIRFLPDKFPKALFLTWLKIHLRCSRQIVCVSQHLERSLPKNSKISVIYDGLPRAESYNEKMTISNRILYLGNIINGKGQEHALKAFAKIATRWPTWKIRFVGGDMGLRKNMAFKQSLKAMCKQNNLEGQVEWCGLTDDVELEFKTAAIALNFSESESFSLTCLEALFFGCPVIATQSGGPAEIINNEETGFLVPLGDINKMADAIENLIMNEEKRKRLAENGRKHVRMKFSKENTTNKLEVLYKELCY
jgi:L-malate glycosyltransferase